MNRKFFNLLLMGALAVTAIGSVSSCKDYDDDINNLQKQIDQAALKTEVTALQTTLANVQSAATAAQAAADQALTKAVGGQTAADGAQTTADEALAKAEEALATALAALPSTDATAIREALATINATAEENATNVAKAIQDAADAAAAAAAANTAAGNAQTSADAANAAAEEAMQAAADSAQAAKAYAKAYTDEQIAAALANVESTLSAVENDEAVIAAIKSIAQAQVNAAIPANLAEKLEGLQTLIDNAGTKEDIEKLLISVKSYEGGINALFTAVTGVSVVGSLYGDEFTGEDITVEITCGKVTKDNTLGKDDKESDNATFKYNAKKTVTYTKDTMFSYADGELLVRVNPTNVDLTTADIKFIDSKGNDLAEVIKVAKVEKFNKLLTRGTGNETGLWKLTLENLKDGDGVKAATQSNNKSILFAVGVNNTKASTEFENAADRYVVSSYDVAFGTKAYVAPTKLDNVKVYSSETYSITLSSTGGKLSVNNGEEFYVSFADGVATESNKGATKDFQYFYVVRDDSHAGEEINGTADPYELNVWDSYKYEGLGEMIPVNHGDSVAALKVTIPSGYTTGDEVQFRVFAIDYTGAVKLNKAFRVFVGADKNEVTVTGNLKATGFQTMATDTLSLSGTLKAGYKLDDCSTVVVKNAGGSDVTLKVAYFDKDKKAITSNIDPTKVKYVQFSINESTETTYGDMPYTSALTYIQKLADGAVATGVIKGSDVDEAGTELQSVVANTIKVSLTKVMPTAADVDAYYTAQNITWKAAQLKNGVHTAYLYPYQEYALSYFYTGNEWQSAATTGYKKLGDAFNGLPNDAHAKLKIANAALKSAADGKSSYSDDLVVPGNEGWILKVSTAAANDAAKTKLIDNETQHTATFGYDFGAISSVKTNNAYAASYYKEATSSNYKFQIVFASPLNEEVQKFAFKPLTITNADGTTTEKKVTVLKYGEAVPVNLDYSGENGDSKKNIASYLVSTNSIDKVTFDGTFVKSGDVNSLYHNRYITNSAAAKLISNETGTEDYFSVSFWDWGYIKFTPKAEASRPTTDVASTLVLTLEDCFGQTHEYKFDFTVLKQ